MADALTIAEPVGATVSVVAEHLVTPDGVGDDVVIEVGGSDVIACRPFDPVQDDGLERIGGWVVPGFIDTHVHGGGGFDYATDDPQQAVQARAFHAAHGTTTSFASLVAASVDTLCGQISILADLVDDGYFSGIHLEGPFLAPEQRGAHDPELLRSPDPASVEKLITAGRGSVSMITIAPELPGAITAIGRFVEAGVRVAVGHTDADRDTVAAALGAGATSATHLFNAMRGVHHRRPGPVPPLLDDPKVGVEMIADGIHLHPDVLRMVAAAAGPLRTILVTDAMVATGMPDGEFTLGGLEVVVRDGVARLVRDDGAPGSIAGSTLTMAGAFELMTSLLGDIPTVAGMAAANAARHFDLEGVGRIEAGGRADLCVVDDHGALQRVMQSGQWLEPAAGS